MERLSSEAKIDRLSADVKMERLRDKSLDRLEDKLGADRLTSDRLTSDKVSVAERFVRAEADVGSGLKPARPDDRLDDATSNCELLYFCSSESKTC